MQYGLGWISAAVSDSGLCNWYEVSDCHGVGRNDICVRVGCSADNKAITCRIRSTLHIKTEACKIAGTEPASPHSIIWRRCN